MTKPDDLDMTYKDLDILYEQLEMRLREVYSQAAWEMSKKVKQFYAKFKELDTIKRKQVKLGKLSQADYIEWRRNKMLMGRNYEDMVDVLTRDMTNTNQIASSITNGYTPEAYALGVNHGTYEVEHGTSINTNFTLYNRQTVERLIADNPNIIPRKIKIDIPKDLRWNEQKINNAITQSILQGESIPHTAQRLQTVASMNNIQATRTARTAMTAANNAGHAMALERAQNMGIKLNKQWLATLDSRTRDTHALLDGESIPLDQAFSNGLMYPGDPDGPPEEVYNCRCRKIADILGIDQGKIDDLNLRSHSNLGDMTYDQWKAYHREHLDKRKKK